MRHGEDPDEDTRGREEELILEAPCCLLLPSEACREYERLPACTVLPVRRICTASLAGTCHQLQRVSRLGVRRQNPYTEGCSRALPVFLLLLHSPGRSSSGSPEAPPFGGSPTQSLASVCHL
uniref:Uncharacterized protein n=1 Tax=Rousettus aegyptiacus TaxID=9407 RepID=A0A7J8C2L7_ROUAE|nr:hypothetical protein HJG63_009406 [Rousettus aegyptiacus]